MAIDLPVTSRQTSGNASRRIQRGRGIPDASDVQQVRGQSDPGLRVPDIARTMGGDELGKGLTRLGVGLSIEDERQQRAKDRQQKEFDAIKTTEASLAYDREGMEEFRRLQTEGDPTDPKFTASYEDWLKKKDGDLTGRLHKDVSPLAREELRLKLEAKRNGMVDAAGRLAIQQSQAKSVDLIGQQANVWSAQASRDPAFLEQILDQVDDGLKPFAGTLNPNMERDVRAKARQQVIQSAVSGLVRGDNYAEAEKIMASGKYDADLGPEALRGINADIQRGKNSARTEIREVANDHLASLTATGVGVAGLSDKAAKVLEPKDLQDFRAREQTARQVFSASQGLKFATPEQMAGTIAGLAPKAGSPRFADEQRVHEGLSRQAQNLLKMRTDDPVGYSMQAPEVAEAFKAAGQNPNLLPGAIQKSLALQEQMGIPEHERRVLTRSGAEGEASRLNNLQPEQMADAVLGLSKTYGKHWPRAYGELVANRLSSEATILATLDAPSDAVTRKDLAQALQVGKKTLTANLKDTEKGATDRALDEAMGPWARAELSRGATDANVQSMRSAAEMLAYSYVSRGMTPQKAAEQAANGIALKRYDILEQPGFSMYVPKGMGEKVSETATRLLQDLKSHDLMDPGGMPSLKPDERQTQYLENVRRGKWVLDGQGTGAILLDEIGQPAMSADTGRPISFKFDHMDSLLTSKPVTGQPSTESPHNPLRGAPPSDRVPPAVKPQKTGAVTLPKGTQLSDAEVDQAIERGPPYPETASGRMTLTKEQASKSAASVFRDQHSPGDGLQLDEHGKAAATKENWLSSIGGAVSRLFGHGESDSNYLGDAPKRSDYPSKEEGAAALKAGIDYGSGFESVLREGRVRDATRLRGDLGQLAETLARKKSTPNPQAAEDLTRALVASRRNAIAGLGFDPTKVAIESSGAKFNLGGFYSPSKDLIWTSSSTPSALVHESVHRGLKLLKDAGVLSAPEATLIENQEEAIVRYIMARDMGDVEGGSGDISKKQRDDAVELFENTAGQPGRASLSAKYRNILSSVEKKAASLFAKNRPGGPR